MTALAVVVGALAAAGVMLLVRELWPAPPQLDAALARIQTTRLAPEVQHGRDLTDTVGRWLADRLARPAGVLAVPRRDLALLGRPVERFMLAKLALFVAGTVTLSVLWGLLALTGTSPPWVLPTLAGLLLGVALSFVPDLTTRAEAARRRKEFRSAFSAYLQLVVLEREAGAALASALEGPTQVADSWAFGRIGEALAHASRAQQQPWTSLSQLGEQIGVPDLVDLAYTAEIAGGEGAKMHDVLMAKIASMRHEASASARSEANARTTTMWVPLSLLLIGFVVLVGFPFFYRLITTT